LVGWLVVVVVVVVVVVQRVKAVSKMILNEFMKIFWHPPKTH